MRDESGLPARFAAFCAALVRPLPVCVPPSFAGYAIINGFTFGVDLAVLTLARSGLGLPLPVGVTAGYLIAFGLSFVLNRTLNFRSHAPVGGQTVKYAVAVGVNYLVFILGVGAGLAGLGVEYHLSRLLAGAGEAVFMYCVMRWVVFADGKQGTRSKAVTRGQPR
ncbi:GtrA family protein [Amycolatopsis alkalitolerans]|uniref:GtrA family protein n=1 Tax=Amycolatopsis alkalitolerans TaxID=2547244 RepID=A0A5C4LW82_9PSEU|nr:GtrA family protein [Amycolatopsis alkalitolerans]TNC22612.1 GtrA family protein [Amycolatopsis alkalitolerans]